MKSSKTIYDLRFTIHCLAVLFLSLLPAFRAGAQSPSGDLAPGAPGRDAQWESAGKQGVGTSNTLESKVWFTLRGGVLTDVYYPTVDIGNVRLLQFVVVSADGRRVETEADDAHHKIELLDPQALTYRQTNTAKSGAWTITKTYVSDPARPVVLIDVDFKARGRERLYVYYDPSLNNSGMHDSAWSHPAGGSITGGRTSDGALLASDADKVSALLIGPRPAGRLGYFSSSANGYFGTSDGLTQLRRGGGLAGRYVRAADGNVVQVAQIPLEYPDAVVNALRKRQPAPPSGSDTSFTLALGFGESPNHALNNARTSIFKGFESARRQYERSWHEYVKTLRRVAPQYRKQFDVAAMVLKAHEDKSFQGAMIASLSVPWGGGANANEPNVGGYHLVWSRDLYQVATAFYLLGDKSAADRALHYLFKVQQKPDGSFPQNSWLDGRPFWGSLQLDEVAYPLVLAYQLGRTDNETWTKHVKPAADFIVKNGPRTPQERWEEEAGYSPSTIAAEIAGLVCAAEIARRNDDRAAAGVYLAAADEWARNVERWTATTTGRHGDGNYYLRLTEDGDPDDGSKLELNNGAGSFDERDIVDAGFLELVRLGVKRPDDPLVSKSLAVVDKLIRVGTPNGEVFYRYNHDGYGEMDDGRPWNFDGKYTGKGRPWPLLAGERGEYELARGQRARAVERLDAMQRFANEGMMIPEQVWDKPASPIPGVSFGEGTGSATPLAWSMAGFIRLAVSLEENRNPAMPDIVAARYAKGTPPRDARASAESDSAVRLDAGAPFSFETRLAPGSKAFLLSRSQARELNVEADGRVRFDVEVPAGDSAVAFATASRGGATSFQRWTIRGLTADERRRERAEMLTPAFVEKLKNARVSPVVEGDRATFVYRGPAKSVEVVGDFTNWSPRRLRLEELPGTDIKFYAHAFPTEARLEYKLIADGQWTLDPFNPNRIDNGLGGENSVLEMPAYRASPEAGRTRDGMSRPAPEDAAGQSVAALKPRANGGPQPGSEETAAAARAQLAALESFEVPSRVLGGARRVRVYLPKSYGDRARRFPVLYVQDGSDYLKRARADAVAGSLVEQQKVEPFIIVFVDPSDRMKEYWADDRFADFMAKELVPFIDARFRTRAGRDSRALLGASLGGVASVWTALRHPEVFARVGGQSSAFQIDDERVVAALDALGEARPGGPAFRFYFGVGRFEPILEVSRRVRTTLAAKGYPVAYRETETGHNFTAWRDQLAEAMLALWRE